MSHVITMQFFIRNLEALKLACEELGLEFREGQTTWKWWGKWVDDYHSPDAAYKNGISPEDYGKCSHALAVKGNANAYEMGLVETPKGYALVYDFYGNQGRAMQQKVGANGAKLQASYAKHTARLKMMRQGYRVSENKLKDGTVEIICTSVR